MPHSRLTCQHLPTLEAEMLQSLRGTNRMGTAGVEPTAFLCMAVALGAGDRLWVHWERAGSTAGSAQSGSAKGFGVRVWVFQLLPLVQV